MEVQFSYKVDSMLKAKSLNGFSDVVTKIGFTTFAEKDGIKIAHPLNIQISAPEEGSDFIELSDLKEEDVIAWIEKDFDMTLHKEALIGIINEKLEPKEEPVDLPWAEA